MPEWANLPKDLLDLITKSLTSTDILRFRSVCTSWRSSVPPKARNSYFKILPNDGISQASFGFHLSKRTIFIINPLDTHNHAESCSWLVKIKEDKPHAKHYLNPLSRIQKNSLPNNFPRVLDLMHIRVREVGEEYTLHHLSCKPYSSSGDAGNLYMEKVVILRSDSVSDKDFVLLTIHVSGKLAMFKSGDKRWTIIQDMPSPYDDVIVYQGSFYGVDNTGRMVSVGLDAELGVAAHPVFGGDKKYLVESEGELWLVDMYLSIDSESGSICTGEEFLEHLVQYMCERTVRFKVFKLDQVGQQWIELKDLGDRVLFLGDDCTFSVSAADLGCRGNCIFFIGDFALSKEEYLSQVDDAPLESRDLGVYELESGSLGPLRNYPEYSKIFWPPPSWVASTSLEGQNQSQLEEGSL